MTNQTNQDVAASIVVSLKNYPVNFSKVTFLKINKILLLKNRSMIFIPEIIETSETLTQEKFQENLKVVISLIQQLNKLGYILDKKLIDSLFVSQDISYLKNICKDILNSVIDSLGANAIFVPMYPNFPDQVINESEANLYFNAMMHYLGDWVGYRITPFTKKIDERVTLTKFRNSITNSKIIKLVTLEEGLKTFSNLLKSKTSISESDKESLEEFINVDFECLNYILQTIGFPADPQKIPFKENSSWFVSKVSKLFANEESSVKSMTENILNKLFDTNFDNAIDIVRFAVAYSNGDVSLATNSKLKNIPRNLRKIMMYRLNEIAKTSNVAEQMHKFPGKFVRLGEKLHPGEFSKKYQVVYDAFTKIRNNEKIVTLNSRVEALIESKLVVEAAQLLAEKNPGDLGRRLNNLLDKSLSPSDRNIVIKIFGTIADKLKTPMLLQIIKHFERRYTKDSMFKRIVMPKGNVQKFKIISDTTFSGSEYDHAQIIGISTRILLERFSKLPKINETVYIGDEMEDYLVPFSQRSASKQLVTCTRGSKFKVNDETNIVRLFTHWLQPENQRVDIDLSVVLLGDDCNYLTECSFRNLKIDSKLHWSYTSKLVKIENYIAVHSGDLTSAPAPNGAAEFVDIDIEKCVKAGVRYACVTFHSFNGVKFVELPECFGGWMERKDMMSGEIFEPQTVVQKFDITGDTHVNFMAIFDLVERKITWTDMSRKSNDFANSCRTDKNKIEDLVLGFTKLLNKPDLYMLFLLHCQARGAKFTSNKNEATLKICENGDIKPTDLEKIVGEFLI